MAIPAISFVLPVFNVEAYLPKCLDSLLGQSRRDIEIIVVDDGSTDGSLAICREHAARDARIVVFAQPNQGQGVARNRGVQAANGRYISFVDPDDWLEPEMAADLLPAMFSSGADFANFGIDFIDEKGALAHRLPTFTRTELSGEAILHAALIDRDVYSSPCNKVYTREFLQRNRIEFPTLRAYEDIFYSRTVALHARKCIFIDRVYYHALIRAGSTTRRMDSSRIREAVKLVELERAGLIGPSSSARVRDLFDAHVVKLMSGLLIQAAFRIADRRDYLQCGSIAAALDFRALCRNPAALALLKPKNRWMARVVQYPRLTRLLATVLKRLGIEPY